MKFSEVGVRNPNALAALQELQPLEFALYSPLRRLDFLIGFLNEHNLEKEKEYISNLEKKYGSLIEQDYFENKELSIEQIISEFQNLKHHPKLAMNSLNFFLNVLELEIKSDWEKSKLEVPQRNYLRSFLVPKYINVEELINTVGRERGIKLYKRYLTEFIYFVGLDKEDNVKDLESMWEKYFNTDRESELDSWLVVQSKPENGKLTYRKEMCLWNEALTDLSDIELKYLVCCYGDFQGVKRENKHFVLTMEHTVVEGDPYCSCIVHDTRIDWNLKHPPKKYWDEIWPLQEWQKKITNITD